ncbi:alpha/beta fold hydrolase [Stutzerimonas urumqiensis]|uniref:alpha/beta family hydrolase n=1 Tax=Stutzerimonas urumqiensis TaxID=638269 RepID=UPI003BAAF0F4
MGKAFLCGIDRDQFQPGAARGCGIVDNPAGKPWASLVLAHGAGAPMDSPFMQAMAERLAARGIQVLRFEFGYMAARREDGRRRPPSPQGQLLDEWREALAQARKVAAGPVAIGGKSMGGRMASLLADESRPLALVCLGYPFHPAGKPEKPRVAHLERLATPTLIVQGERDALGGRERVERYALAPAIRLAWLEAADHDLKPLVRSGHTAEGHLDRCADRVAEFLREQVAARSPSTS